MSIRRYADNRGVVHVFLKGAPDGSAGLYMACEDIEHYFVYPFEEDKWLETTRHATCVQCLGVINLRTTTA